MGNLYNNVGNRPYFRNENERVMKQKVNHLTYYYFKDKPRLTPEEEVTVIHEFKTARTSKKPRYRKEDRRDDLGGDPLVFPYRYRWTGVKFYDQHWSSIAVGFSEIEDARRLAEPARKVMFKATNSSKSKDPYDAFNLAVEIWLWKVSAHCEGKLSQYKLRVQDKDPCLAGENDWDKVKLPTELENFKQQFLIWMNDFAGVKS